MARLYLLIIFLALCLLMGLNSYLATSVYQTSIETLISAILVSFVIVVIIDTLFAILVGILPKKWFGVNNKLLSVSKKEQKFYEKLHIRKWKDYVWDLGCLGGFSKQEVKDPKDPRYFEKFIIESNRGVTEHTLGIVVSYVIIFIYPQYAWSVGVPIALVNTLLNSMSTMVLRYNLPKLKTAYTILVKRQSTNIQTNLLQTQTEEEHQTQAQEKLLNNASSINYTADVKNNANTNNPTEDTKHKPSTKTKKKDSNDSNKQN